MTASAPAIHIDVLDWNRDLPMQMGRHVEHHADSLEHPAAIGSKLVTRLWAHNGPVLNQGKIGACTGNGMADAVNTDYWTPTREKIKGAGVYLDEDDALAFYRLATKLDNIPGQYPPTDTGSTGIAVAKAAKALGYVSTFTHAFGLQHLIGALQLRPVICGTVWTNDMFTPDAQGFVAPTGDVAGGHEYLCLGVDMENEFLTFLNSWSASWGLNGRFKIKFADYDQMLAAHGDVVVPLPMIVDAPAPVAA